MTEAKICKLDEIPKLKTKKCGESNNLEYFAGQLENWYDMKKVI
jgi:hypothetical protein